MRPCALSSESPGCHSCTCLRVETRHRDVGIWGWMLFFVVISILQDLRLIRRPEYRLLKHYFLVKAECPENVRRQHPRMAFLEFHRKT